MEGRQTIVRYAVVAGLAVLAVSGLWSFWVALRFPIDSWDAYDYLINARLLAGHDLSRLSQGYRPDRPPGISLLAAPLLAVGYQPGQRGLTGLIHLIPWSLGIATIVALFREVRSVEGLAEAVLASLVLVLNPLVIHFLPFMMADVPSMAFSFAALLLAERVIRRRRLGLGAGLACMVAAAMCSKYPVAALGLTIPLANALSLFWGEGKTSGFKATVVGLLRPRLALSLVAGLVLFLAVHAVITSKFIPGDAPWWTKLSNGLRTAWSGGGGAGDLDPWWEIPSVLWWTFGPPVVVLAGLGAAVSVVRGELRGLLHTTWVLGFVLLFVVVIGHRESRYAMPVLPSVALLAARGVFALRSKPAVAFVAALIGVVGIVPGAYAEGRRMSDPLYTRPTILAWARAALDAAGSDRPILQLPHINQFALYPKDPVVLPTDEYWHYHHFNEGGLVWFFDRRLLGMQVMRGQTAVVFQSAWIDVTVPGEWLDAIGEDAVWLAGFPKGAVIVSTQQQWFETRNAPSQQEPPAPFLLTDLRRVTAVREGDRYVGDGVQLTPRREGEGEGWRFDGLPSDSRWYVVTSAGPRRLAALEPELPERLEGITLRRETFPIRP